MTKKIGILRFIWVKIVRFFKVRVFKNGSYINLDFLSIGEINKKLQSYPLNLVKMGDGWGFKNLGIISYTKSGAESYAQKLLDDQVKAIHKWAGLEVQNKKALKLFNKFDSKERNVYFTYLNFKDLLRVSFVLNFQKKTLTK